jgi:membrane protease YdiL (CAAX protease family)
MMDRENLPRRSWAARIFLSADELRLRAGWRLLLHTVLVFGFTTALLMLFLFIPFTPSSSFLIQLVSVTLATWVARRLIDRRSFRSLGFQYDRQSLYDLGIGIVIPACMMMLIFLIELAMGWLQIEAWAWQRVDVSVVLQNLIGTLVVFIAVGFYEEILSRGYHLQNILDGTNLPLALFLSSSVFSVLHFANDHATWQSGLGILAAGYFFGYTWVRTRRLWLPIGLHIGWNFFEGPIFGFPVSGTKTPSLILHLVDGPTLFTGGEFGPEAGLVMLPALALGASLIWLYTRHRTLDPT